MNPRRIIWPAVILALAASGVRAQTVYRCGAEGRSYSQEPCSDGRAVDASDPRTPQQVADGRHAAAREKALADNLERERRAKEASQREATAAASFKARSAATAASEPVVRHFVRRRAGR